MSLSLRVFHPRCDKLSLRVFHPRCDKLSLRVFHLRCTWIGLRCSSVLNFMININLGAPCGIHFIR